MSHRFLLSLLLLSNAVFAQNLNTTFRSKLSYPTQTLANVWGYTVNGHEYALVGAQLGLIIVDITNPDQPQQIVQIPGPNNLWKEIKTYQHYAYITSEGGGGVQIVDLQNLPSSNLPYKNYKGDGAIQNQLNNIHALHIDETKGFLYAWGSNLFGGGAVIMDLKTDPWNPVYVGKYQQSGYIHDGYVDNDTMYSGHIYNGYFAIVNMADKAAPELINTQMTPNAFTHNTWLSADRRVIYATDERENSFLSSWDVSDPTDIKFLDKIQSNPGSNSIVHNTYTLGNWVLSSWYRDGFTIVDGTRPDNLIQVGNYDTYPATGCCFQGCWGVYPYFPSGNIIASNIGAPGELFVITPNYKRACYVEGDVVDANSGLPLQNASVSITPTSPAVTEFTATNGTFKTGYPTEGSYHVIVEKKGYHTFDTLVNLVAGQVINLHVPMRRFNVSGTVFYPIGGQAGADAKIWLVNAQHHYTTNADGNGKYRFESVSKGQYSLIASIAGGGSGAIYGLLIEEDTIVDIPVYQLHRDVLGENGQSGLKTGQNPFRGATQLEYNAPYGASNVRLVDQNGRVVFEQPLEDAVGAIQVGQDLAPGIYLAILSGKTSAESAENSVLDLVKIIKQQ